MGGTEVSQQNRMIAPSLSSLADRVRDLMRHDSIGVTAPAAHHPPADADWEAVALDLFELQYATVPAYRILCESRGLRPGGVRSWREIPAVPTTAFQELEFSAIAPEARTRVFHSSGTTGQRPSRHFHHAESLALYEDSLRPWFATHLLASGPSFPADLRPRCLALTPLPQEVPNSSLVHMFEVVVRDFGGAGSGFTGGLGDDGAWELGLEPTLDALEAACEAGSPILVLGTAFLFVHLLDALEARGRSFRLPAGSRVLETGGYKGRSRSLPRQELHSAIAGRLGGPEIIPEYGMSELSSQAYESGGRFRFPAWVRIRTVHPESGLDVGEGETGLLRIHDLANVWSVAALETGDLARRYGQSFELLGRAAEAEPRGCSRMTL
jgi:hypothetical protein